MTCYNATKQGSGSAIVYVTPEQTPTTATINVFANLAAAGWTINPGSLTGSGTSGYHTVTPGTGGTTYIISPTAVSGYTYEVTNSLGGGSSMAVYPGTTRSFTINYTAEPSFDYTLSASPSTLTVTKSSSNVFATETITKTLTTQSGSPSGTFDVTLDENLQGVSYSIANRNCQPTCQATINFTITPSASVGTFPITVNASPKNKTTTFNLQINAASGPTVSCTPSSGTVKVGDLVTWSGGVSGGTAPFTYRWSGSGISTTTPPSTQNFSMRYTTVGTKTAQLTVTDANGQTGVCNPAGTLQVNFNPTYQEF